MKETSAPDSAVLFGRAYWQKARHLNGKEENRQERK